MASPAAAGLGHGLQFAMHVDRSVAAHVLGRTIVALGRQALESVPSPLTVEVPAAHIGVQQQRDELVQFGSERRIDDIHDSFDAMVEVALHEVGGTDEPGRAGPGAMLAAVREVIDA